MSSPLQATRRRVTAIGANDLTSNKLWVVVFGPGHGEAILLRLPDGRVGIVDGCRDSKEACPVTRLLRELAVQELLFVCMTHPHEDHYMGLARLLTAYKGHVEHVWHALALTDHERIALMKSATDFYASVKIPRTQSSRARKVPLPDVASLNGLEAVLYAIVAASRHPTRPARRRQLVVERPLLSVPIGSANFVVEAWGPSDDDVLEVMARFLTKRGKKSTKQSDLPNMVSGSLLLQWGTSRVLLAGDLFAHQHQQRGWSPAVARALQGPVQVVNVAHHASHNAHDVALWSAMSPTLALVTPFRKALRKKGRLCNPPLPRDLKRYLDEGAEVVVTTKPEWLAVGKHQPRPTHGLSTSSPYIASSLLQGAVAAPQPGDTDNAVAVALDACGNITDIILAGEADFYT